MAKGIAGSWQHNTHDGVYELVIGGVFTARIIPSGDPYDRRCFWRLYAEGAVTHEASSLYAAMRAVRRALRERAQGGVTGAARDDERFYQGMIAALAVVALYDAETLFREIVNTADEAELVRVARKHGNMRWSGLMRYGYGKRKARD